MVPQLRPANPKCHILLLSCIISQGHPNPCFTRSSCITASAAAAAAAIRPPTAWLQRQHKANKIVCVDISCSMPPTPLGSTDTSHTCLIPGTDQRTHARMLLQLRRESSALSKAERLRMHVSTHRVTETVCSQPIGKSGWCVSAGHTYIPCAGRHAKNDAQLPCLPHAEGGVACIIATPARALPHAHAQTHSGDLTPPCSQSDDARVG